MSTSHIKDLDLATLDLDQLKDSELMLLLEYLDNLNDEVKYNKLRYIFPDTGPLRRSLYKKHIDFINAGKYFRERCIFGANRSGKSFTALSEGAYHVDGYPSWYDGKKYYGDILMWCIAPTHQKVTTVAQAVLLGSGHDIGSGLIPKKRILFDSIRSKQGVANGISEVRCERFDGGIATIRFMSYDQKRDAFQGDEVHWAHLDEEEYPDSGIYSEVLTRTMTTDGCLLTTCTFLHGFTEIVMRFLPQGRFPENDKNIVTYENGLQRWISNIRWDDNPPHLTEKAKQELKASYNPREIEARINGYPFLDEGKIITTPEADYTIPSFDIMKIAEWGLGYGLDIAFTTGYTAAVFCAVSPDKKRVIVYDVYKCSQTEPPIYCEAIKRHGEWIPGAVDPSARKYKDHRTFLQIYEELGLNLTSANNDLTSGLMLLTNMLRDGSLQIMSHCSQLLQELRIYRWGKDGKPAKDQNDHCADALRYFLMSGMYNTISWVDHDQARSYDSRKLKALKQLGRDPITGY